MERYKMDPEFFKKMAHRGVFQKKKSQVEELLERLPNGFGIYKKDGAWFVEGVYLGNMGLGGPYEYLGGMEISIKGETPEKALKELFNI